MEYIKRLQYDQLRLFLREHESLMEILISNVLDTKIVFLF